MKQTCTSSFVSDRSSDLEVCTTLLLENIGFLGYPQFWAGCIQTILLTAHVCIIVGMGSKFCEQFFLLMKIHVAINEKYEKQLIGTHFIYLNMNESRGIICQIHIFHLADDVWMSIDLISYFVEL